MEASSSPEDDIDDLHFPVDAVRERLLEANVSNDVGPHAAVYCSAILQFLTSKVLDSAVKVIDSSPNHCKRRRSDDDDDGDQAHKKRRICPKDITRALQTDPCLKEWADLIQIPCSDTNDTLNKFVISLEGNFSISDTIYCEMLKEALELEYSSQLSCDNIYKKVLYKKDCIMRSLRGIVLCSSVSQLLTDQFVINPCLYSFTFLYHSSTILSQQLHAATSFIDNGFFLMNRSPLSLLSMAMLFLHKKYITKEDFRLYLNSHRSELFPPCFISDLTIFIEHENIKYKKEEIFDKKDRCLMDDFFFELLIKRMASRKYGKYIFYEKKEIELNNFKDLSKIIINVLLNKKRVSNIYWESDLKAFNNVQNPNVVNPNKRIVYTKQKQIINALNIIKRGELTKCDIVYIHISLWMKPKREFKRLIIAHLCRFDDICFYALRHRDLDDRAKQIVQWIFAK